MRPISRTAMGAACAAVLAVTAAAPSVAEPRAAAGTSPLVGSAPRGEGSSVVTLVTGDRVLVTSDGENRAGATVLPDAEGAVPLVQTRQSGKDLYVYPEGAVHAIADGRVDEELFNVTGLVRQGYDDAHAKKLPLIAVYDKTVDVTRSVPATLRGAERGLVLEPVDGVALKADKKKATGFWADFTSAKSRSGYSTSGMKKLWLDAKVRATLDRSTKQVHAPEAWAAGYDGKGTKVAVLDTGADAEHPDLKGRIAATKNFTDSPDNEDRQGHGTHTTSTVGGTGAASGGKKKGVAPGADLLHGKVLDDSGSGATSWIIAGMQWAVDEKADVVSMSLGNPARTDCTDPMSMATEELARSATDTLFVLAAGNTGPTLNSVSSPGCAPSVLTVGAVDRDDSTAPFSSRGPAYGSHTLKPEIAAPGVAISAAAAGGRGVYAYQSMSGTSMATPHVAGAAALVKQRHPEWNARQIKSALVSSADSRIPGDVTETGGGRLDVKAAVDQKVLGSPAVQGGSFGWPQDNSDRTSVDVPYTNTTDRTVELKLTVQGVTGNDGSAVRSGVARLGERSVKVPAGASVKVPLKLDPDADLARSQYGDVTGRVLAKADGGIAVSTPFSLYVQPKTVSLRVKLVDRGGKPADGPSSVDVIGTDDASGERRFNEGANDQTFQVRPGAYFLTGYIATPDADGGTLTDSLTHIARPQVEVKKDTTLTLDARTAHRLAVKTDKESEVRGATLGFARTWGTDHWLHAGTAAGPRSIRGFYQSVEGKAKDGTFESGSYWRAAAPQLTELSVVGGESLHPVTASTGSANLDGTGRAALVDAKSGTPAELEAAGVKGKIALVKVPDSGSASAVATNAKAAGAIAVIAHRAAPGRWYPSVGLAGSPLPVLGIETTEAATLLSELSSGPVELKWKGVAKSPFVYNLAFPESGQIREDRTYRVRDKDLAANEATYRAMGAATDYVDLPSAVRPSGLEIYFADIESVPAPGKRTEYYSAGTTGWGHQVSSSFPFGEFMIDPVRTYEKGERRDENWYEGVLTPAAPRDAEGGLSLAGERQGNLIGVAPGFWADSEHAGIQGGFGDIGSVALKRNGEVVGESGWPSGVFTVPAEDSAYELTLTTHKIGSKVWKRSTGTSTTWAFRSHLDEEAYSQGIPMLFPRYALPEDGMKTLAAEDGQRIGLTVTGHAGYKPGAVKSAALSYSYDEGETWTKAATSASGGKWTATVNHAGASGKQVWLKTELTDTNGSSVTQTVARAYDVR
ncbi:S8 family serine peptidase [Streptomyces sp. NPDC048436]|uniref:S8 family peptidase n=1 Tax=Streptomyces sp. NPDC048436 TaxID=3365550 RepID=UPI0037107FF0